MVFYDKHNCPQRDSIPGPRVLQSGILPLDHCDLHMRRYATTIRYADKKAEVMNIRATNCADNNSNVNAMQHNNRNINNYNKLCGRPPQYAPAPCKSIFDLLTLKVVSESRATWTTSVPLCSRLAQCTRQTDARRASSLNAPTLGAGA